MDRWGLHPRTLWRQISLRIQSNVV